MAIDPKFLTELATLGGILFTMYFTGKSAWLKKAEMDESKPEIAKIDQFNKHIRFILTNNKPYNITIKSMKVQEYRFLNFCSENIPLKWTPEYKEVPLTGNALNDAFAKFNASPIFAISDQVSITVELERPLSAPKYKISVKTTGGRCQSICRCLSEHPV